MICQNADRGISQLLWVFHLVAVKAIANGSSSCQGFWILRVTGNQEEALPIGKLRHFAHRGDAKTFSDVHCARQYLCRNMEALAAEGAGHRDTGSGLRQEVVVGPLHVFHGNVQLVQWAAGHFEEVHALVQVVDRRHEHVFGDEHHQFHSDRMSSSDLGCARRLREAVLCVVDHNALGPGLHPVDHFVQARFDLGVQLHTSTGFVCQQRLHKMNLGVRLSLEMTNPDTHQRSRRDLRHQRECTCEAYACNQKGKEQCSQSSDSRHVLGCCGHASTQQQHQQEHRHCAVE
mmetsp:Transcript_20304/g.43326  ORF Transcript_20304/g.43326 Transcript_20304/m.43326 type:complete len:289 (+) Transcript_20304:809-1675(+)